MKYKIIKMNINQLPNYQSCNIGGVVQGLPSSIETEVTLTLLVESCSNDELSSLDNLEKALKGCTNL